MGSEMCIRDRLSCERTLAGRLLDEDRSARVSGGLMIGGKELAMTCLLYTSDAADDLLCVDLGGRRIIKKKKPPN